jgi:hypothetical protein
MVIGDGYGFLSSVIKRLYPFAKIVLVDIGKVLLFQCVNLQVIFPKNLHLGILNGFEISGKFDFLYCPAEDIEKLTGINFQLVVNISSMQEMDMTTIKRYFDYIRFHVTPDNLFYCCNRESKELPGGETINFSDYPWMKEDRHLIDEEPAFYRYYFTGKFPFIRYFDGPIHHRLTNMKTKEETKTHET